MKELANLNSNTSIDTILTLEEQEDIISRISRGAKISELCTELSITPMQIINSCKGYEAALMDSVMHDKDFLERKSEHIKRTLAMYDIIFKEVNKVYEDADTNKDKLMATKQMTEITEKKAKVMQLLGSQVEITHKIIKAEKTQQQIIMIVSEVTGECTRCRNRIKKKLHPLMELSGEVLDASTEN